jgi:predicted TIM-barrel fold metal-dependent hydrolase
VLVVDAHVHLWPDRSYMPEHVWETFQWVWGRRMFGTPTESAMAELLEGTWDPDGTRLVAEMDAAGVAASVVMPMDFGLAVGEAARPIRDKVQSLAAIASASAGRIFSFCGVDPRRPEACDLVREAVEQWGCKGVKLYPATGFFPHDPVCDPLYELVAELAVPVLFHCGPVGYPLKSRYSRPSEIEAVAADYPDVRIVLGHTSYGRAWFDEALDVAAWKPNLLVEVSGLAAYASTEGLLRRLLRRMIDTLGPDRVLFGSDRAGFPGAAPGRWPELWRSLADHPAEGLPAFEQAEIAAVLGLNANREFGLGLSSATTTQPDVWPRFPVTPVRKHRR